MYLLVNLGPKLKVVQLKASFVDKNLGLYAQCTES